MSLGVSSIQSSDKVLEPKLASEERKSCPFPEHTKIPQRSKHSLSPTTKALKPQRPSKKKGEQRHSVLFKTQFCLNVDDINNTGSHQSLVVPSSYDLNRTLHEEEGYSVSVSNPSNSSDGILSKVPPSDELKSDSIETNGMKESCEVVSKLNEQPIVVSTHPETSLHSKKDSKEKVGKTTKVKEGQLDKDKILIRTSEELNPRPLMVQRSELDLQRLKEAKRDFAIDIFEDVALGKVTLADNETKSAQHTPREEDEASRRKTMQPNGLKRNLFLRRENSDRVRKNEDESQFVRVQKGKGAIPDDNEETETFSDDTGMEQNEGLTHTYVDKEDLDILISGDDSKLRKYLERNRITVGFPIKGYKEALVLDIRNGDDNPFEQMKEINAMVNKRKTEFIEQHQGIIVKEITIEEKDKKKRGKVNKKNIQVVTFKGEEIEEKEMKNEEKMRHIQITGFSNQKEYFNKLNEKEQSQFENYKNTLMELWFTEENHVQSLDILLNCYLKPLNESKYNKSVRKMNIQIEQLLKLHTLFYNKLTGRIDQAGDDIPIISDLLRYFFHFVKSTCPYIVEYNSNLRLVNELVKHSTAINIIEESRKKYEESHQGIVIQRIQSYLIMPIQRIPRYVLLIKDMLKNSPPLSPDTDKLVECYQLILDVAAWINEKKLYEEEREKYNIVLKIITGLYDMNKSCRRFIVSGYCKYLDMESPNGVNSAYFFLFNDVLIETQVIRHHNHKIKRKQLFNVYKLINDYGTVEDFKDDMFQVQCVFMVTEDAIVSYGTNPSFGPSISFTSPLSDMQVTLVFDNPLDANAWFVALAYTIKLSPRLNESKNIFNIRNE
ncbi:rho/RAC guanine nucleotide exchange factor, putative [Entamoeba histolytica KU27]|uniref:Rho/RAC guanine nucleotide exchange factor, putative n=1 Tax=Entamoeba histolytica KU27 TaxID=885311 RepID=M2RQA7_ENTHI|nr:rho/RAC guanine nucleotide exchange factor, putative [Entamoeba histolytica KU27]